MFSLLQLKNYDHLLTILNIYSLTESLCFSWVILQNTASSVNRMFIKTLMVLMSVWWLVFVMLLPGVYFQLGATSRVFSTVYEISSAFFAGFALLRLVEKDDDALSLPDFWFLLGIFFYCFCTFFIMGFLNTILSQEIWFLNNIFNIITYGFYSIGLWKFNKQVRFEHIAS
jgi:hypothetical protein